MFTPLVLSSGKRHPYLLYGTAFKKERTGELTTLALQHGFEGIDTANYPSGYEEALAGDGITKSGVNKNDILIQTKFTPQYAHEEGKLPYNSDQSLEAQIRESIEQSFVHLNVSHIDLFLLHVPFEDEADDLLAWKVFESYVPARISTLGVSNFPLPAFEKLYNAATIKPEVVQNRFNANRGYDIPLRNYLAEKGFIYQAFALLKPPNKDIISSEVVARFSKEFNVAKEVAFYLLVLGLGKISIVNGTTSEEHMKVDIEKVQELLGDEKTVEAIKVYLPEFEAKLTELSKLKA